MAERGTYATVTQLKAQIKITATTDDVILLGMLEAASRWINAHCGRTFYAMTETRYYGDDDLDFDVPLKLWVDDLLSITTLKCDSALDGTYSTTLAVTDYNLWPNRGYPKLSVILNDETGDYYAWSDGRRSIQIAGTWGYGDKAGASPWLAVASTGTVATASVTTLAVTNGADFEAGNTILVGTEQMYVTLVTGNNLTVVRGVNGTTAAIQNGAAISKAQYPEAVRQACIMIVGRLYKRSEGSFYTSISNPITGTIETYKGNDPDVETLLARFVRLV